MERPDSLLTIARTLVGIVLVPTTIVLSSVVAIAMRACGASSRSVSTCYRSVSRVAFWVGGTRLDVRGLPHIESQRAYIVVSNHESNWDPLAIIRGLEGLIIRFVIKRQLMQIPIFGHALRATGNIEVRRDRSRADAQRVKARISTRDPDVSLLFFAEGTRSRDGRFLEFKKGAFATALSERLPILPVAVAGSRRIFAPGSPWLRKGTVVLEIGPPIPVTGLGTGDRSALRDRAHDAVGKLRTDARERLRALGEEPGGVD